MSFHAARSEPGLRCLAIIACGFAVMATASAQGVLDQSSNVLGKSPASSSGGTGPLSSPVDQALLRWGPIGFHPSLLYRLSYGDGIQIRPGQSTKSVINEISLGLLLDLGRQWRLDYTSSILDYSSSNFRNGVNQSVNLSGVTTYQDWAFGLTQGYSSSSQVLVETGTQTDQETFTTGISANYRLNQKTSLEMGISQALQSAQQFTSSRQWSTMDWLDYEFAPRFNGALGLGGGYVSLSAGSDNTFEQVMGRFRWKAGEKLTLSVNGGMEYRQFLGSAAPSLFNPLYGLGMAYQLTEATGLSVGVNRAVTSSLFQSQVVDNTSVSASVRQRLFKKLSLEVSGSYGLSTFETTAGGVAVNRKDNLFQYSVRLTGPFIKRGSAAAFYRSNENGSSQAGFGISSTQVGIELGYHF